MDPDKNLDLVKRKISKAARDVGRIEDEVSLVAVSKTIGAEAIQRVIAGGQHVFGENRVQEAAAKWPGLKVETPDIVLHLIGSLQSNKAADAVALFDVIETVDRDRIARVIGEEMKKQQKAVRLYVQVNTGEEEQKAGITPKETVRFVERCRETHGLEIEGLMCIPPIDENPGPHFALLRQLAREAGVQKLSMGMSDDFEIAIGFGATSVRVGSAIFGTRG